MVTAQQLAFWILAPLIVAGALGMVIARKPVHSAISLAGMMVCLGCLYASLNAPFLFVAQIIVYTGAIMMLFLFTMMIIGVDSVESLVETIKGQKILAIIASVAFALLIGLGVAAGILNSAGSDQKVDPQGSIVELAKLIFGPYIFAFEATAALIITGALAAMMLSHGEILKKQETQRQMALRRVREFAEQGANPAPKPGPGIYARGNSIEYPGLRPDGTVEPTSVSPTLKLRGLAIVENQGLRNIHAQALREFYQPNDELTGEHKTQEALEALKDEITVSDSSSDHEIAKEINIIADNEQPDQSAESAGDV